jgi:hypothetical protein
MIEMTGAEVVGVNDSYQYDSSKSPRLFSISVRTISDNIEKIYNDVIPASLNDLKIPLIGEHVIIFKGVGFLDSNENKTYRWYYLPSYNVQSSINHACSPGVAYDPADISNPELLESNQTFEERSISPMQPYEGDNIYQSRWGSSMRFGSTTSATNAHVSPTWVEGDNGDPIIVLSNTKTNKSNKEYVVENLAEDHSSLWLSSTQRLTTLNLHYNLKESTGKDSTNTNNISQFIGIGDRVILHSKSDVVALDSQLAIEMRAPKLVMGGDGDKFGILDSRAVMDALFLIRSIVAYGLEGPASQKISLSEYGQQQSTELFELLLNLTNDNILIDRKSNV